MGDEPATQSDLAAEDRSEDGNDGDGEGDSHAIDDSVDADAGDGIDDDVAQDIVEGESASETSWIADEEKYRCPECEAVHEEPAASCDVCGWVPG